MTPASTAAEFPSRWVAADLPAARSAEMLTLFRDVFGHDLGESMRCWKYHPGRSQAVGVWDRDGRLVAHYGGFSRSLSMFGERAAALQIGDVMVHPAARAVLTRRGAFFMAASRFFEDYVGADKQHCLAFGFPNHRAIRIGQRLGLYAAVEKIFLCSWSANRFDLPFWFAVDPLFAQTGWERMADALWRDMSSTTKDFVLVCRDAAYLNYRYRERPDGGYGVYLVRNRFTRSAVAIVVVKQRDDSLDWMDFVGSRVRIATAAAAVRQLASKLVTAHVTAWLTGCMLEDFAGGGAQVGATDIEIAQSDWKQSHGGANATRGHWWLMYGDTDFL